MNKKNKKLILLFLIILIFIIVVFVFKIPCLFKTIFHISCPGCGLGRAFKSILQLRILESFKYNILGFPLFISFIFIFIITIIDIIKKTNNLEKFYNKIFSKYYIIIIILLIVSFIINIIRNI